MLNLLIKRILAWLAGITAEQWEYALSCIAHANDVLADKTGVEKKLWVLSMFRRHFPDIKESTMNLLIEMAVSFAKKAAKAAA